MSSSHLPTHAAPGIRLAAWRHHGSVLSPDVPPCAISTEPFSTSTSPSRACSAASSAACGSAESWPRGGTGSASCSARFLFHGATGVCFSCAPTRKQPSTSLLSLSHDARTAIRCVLCDADDMMPIAIENDEVVPSHIRVRRRWCGEGWILAIATEAEFAGALLSASAAGPKLRNWA